MKSRNEQFPEIDNDERNKRDSSLGFIYYFIPHRLQETSIN